MQNILDTAERYRKRCAHAARAHYIAWEKAAKNNRRLGTAAILASSIVGASIFSSANNQLESGWLIAIGLLSFLSAFLASLQTFLGFSNLAQNHQSAGNSYASMRRELRLFILEFENKGNEDSDVAIGALRPIVERLRELSESSPSVADKDYDQAVEEITGDRYME